MESITTLKVKKVKRIKESIKVINFTCSPIPYYFANGILSHNCDTPFASIKPEKVEVTKEEMNEFVEKYLYINHVMITGGEPTINPKLLNDLCMYFHSKGFHITIETSGTNFVETVADFISISPKFVCNSLLPGDFNSKYWKILTNEKYPETIAQLIKFYPDFQIKPVIDYDYKSFIELKSLLRYLKDKGINTFGKVYCMPLGKTKTELNKVRKWLVNECIERGYNFTDRLQVVVYGNKRGV